MTSIDALPEAIRDLYPADIRRLYEIHEWRNATAVLSGVHGREWNDLMAVLSAFRLRRSHIVNPGGNKSPVARELDGSPPAPVDRERVRHQDHRR